MKDMYFDCVVGRRKSQLDIRGNSKLERIYPKRWEQSNWGNGMYVVGLWVHGWGMWVRGIKKDYLSFISMCPMEFSKYYVVRFWESMVRIECGILWMGECSWNFESG